MSPPKSVRSQTSTRKATPVDVTVGKRLKARREELGMSRRELCQLCNLSPSQLVKYEQGINRITVSRLQEISVILGTEITWFFGDRPSDTSHPEGVARRQIMHAVHQLKSPEHHQLILAVVHALVGTAATVRVEGSDHHDSGQTSRNHEQRPIAGLPKTETA